MSNLRVFVERTAIRYPVKHSDVFPIVRDALQWIRVLSRQYWIGTGSAGVAAAYRGSTFRIEAPLLSQMNYAGYGHTVLVRSFSLAAWRQVGACVDAQIPVPPAESIFCDALSSFAAGDPVRSLIELGISAEIEITNLLDDVAAVRPTDDKVKGYIEMRLQHKDFFRKKLLSISTDFGLDNPLTYCAPKMPQDWANLLIQLYNFRNKAAHEGRCLIEDKATGTTRPLKKGELQSFIFSVEMMFQWARGQRQKLGFETVATARRDDQILSIIGGIDGGGFSMDTSESCTQI